MVNSLLMTTVKGCLRPSGQDSRGAAKAVQQKRLSGRVLQGFVVQLT